MPLQNRVTPTGEILAAPARGTLMGNRGVLHDAPQRLGPARWRHRRWISCALSHRGWHREVMQPGRYTELFFLDEAVALAAGHRPCALCRREAYERFRAPLGKPSADDLDRLLHAARLTSAGHQRTHEGLAETLPDGAFLWIEEESWVIRGARIHRYTPGGYEGIRARPGGTVTVLTPRPALTALSAGYRPEFHPSARFPDRSASEMGK